MSSVFSIELCLILMKLQLKFEMAEKWFFGVLWYLQGVLDGSEIAVKVLLPEVQQGMEEFSNEIVLVTSMRHKNLVKLKGCCFGDREQRILVYEFVENNNLA